THSPNCSLSRNCLGWRSDIGPAEGLRSRILEFSQRYPVARSPVLIKAREWLWKTKMCSAGSPRESSTPEIGQPSARAHAERHASRDLSASRQPAPRHPGCATRSLDKETAPLNPKRPHIPDPHP